MIRAATAFDKTCVLLRLALERFLHERLGRNAAWAIISAQPKKAGGISFNIIHPFAAGQCH